MGADPLERATQVKPTGRFEPRLHPFVAVYLGLAAAAAIVFFRLDAGSIGQITLLTAGAALAGIAVSAGVALHRPSIPVPSLLIGLSLFGTALANWLFRSGEPLPASLRRLLSQLLRGDGVGVGARAAGQGQYGERA